MFTLTVEARELARGLANALAFMPAVSTVQEVYLRVNPAEGIMRVAGTDSYAAGMELVPIQLCAGPDRPTEFLIRVGQAGREDVAGHGAAGLERAARLAGDAPAQMAFGRDVSLTAGREEATVTELVESAPRLEMYRQLLRLLADAERYEGPTPAVVCLDPALWARFCDGKSIKANSRVADLFFGPTESDPVLIKIGSNFRGLVMPIKKPPATPQPRAPLV